MRTNDISKDTSIFSEGDMFCLRCGQIIPYSTWAKNKSRQIPEWDHCADCRAKPKVRLIINHPILGKIECIPYTGEVNELWQPINAVGDLYMPGERLCGHKDCVNRNHVVKPPKKTMNKLDMILMSTEIRKPRKRVAEQSKIKAEPIRLTD